MANWLTRLFGAGVAETATSIGEMVAKVSEGHLGKKELQLEIEKLLQEREMALLGQVTAEIEAQERIMVAELQQGDTYTKRARPTIIYVGLLGALLSGVTYLNFTLPTDFWLVWGGVCGVYMIGRTVEKRGTNGTAGQVAAAITGSSRLLK